MSDIFRLQYIADNDINVGCFGGFSRIAAGGIPDIALLFTPIMV